MNGPIRSRAGVSRRRLYRAAKSVLRRALRTRWKGSRAGLECAVRAVLRGRSRLFLAEILRVPLRAAAVASCVLASVAAAAQTVELADVAAGTNGFVIEGLAEGDLFGWSVSHAGDVNGDGLADVIVGAPRADAGGETEAGCSYVVFGKADGMPVDAAVVAANDVSVRGESGGFVIRGVDGYDRSGDAVSAAGDVNGDGLDDLIVGAYGADPTGSFGTGRAFVVFGKANGAPVDLTAIAADDASVPGDSGGFVMNGFGNGSRAGDAVSAAGDVNGDGLADLIVGAPWVDVFDGYYRTFAGQAYVVFGKADGAPVDFAAIAMNDASVPGDSGGFVIDGMESFDELGWSVSTAGDMNGDGLGDVLIGARYAALNDGHAYVVFGKADGARVNLPKLIENDKAQPGDSGGFLVDGKNVPGQFGYSVSGAGDVNGDGIPDAIVGSPPTFLYYPNYGTGESYVIFGKADGGAIEADAIAAEDSSAFGDSGGFVINGVAVHDFAGISVSGAGDVNGDGLADLVVGADSADPNGKSFAGQGYVVFGKAGGGAVDLGSLDRHQGLTLNGEVSGDGAGASVSGAGDVNGDGLADVIVGAPWASGHGRAYIVFSPLEHPIFVDFAFDGTELGTKGNPFDTLQEGINAAPHNGTIVLAPGLSNAATRIDKPAILKNGNPTAGTVRIGAG